MLVLALLFEIYAAAGGTVPGCRGTLLSMSSITALVAVPLAAVLCSVS
jgi:hypothetical protein